MKMEVETICSDFKIYFPESLVFMPFALAVSRMKKPSFGIRIHYDSDALEITLKFFTRRIDFLVNLKLLKKIWFGR